MRGRPLAKALSVQWFHGTKPEEKPKLERAIRNDTLVLGRLQRIISGKLDQVNASETKLSVYDTPSWANKQAHINGYKQAYREIEELLSFLPDKGA